MQLTDFTYLNEFSGGDKGFIKEMVEIFVTETPSVLQDLKKAVDAQEWQKAYLILHPLKTNLNFMGIVSLKEKVLIAESCAKHQKEIEKIPALTNEIINVCQQAIEELKAKLATL
jgi:HPt (histidine-containing phosphotransfer) domain-containing protein